MAILRPVPSLGKSVPPICNVNAVINCPHQGGVARPMPKQTQVLVGGAPAMRITDVVGMAFLPGCPNLPTPGTPSFVPCAVVTAPAVAGSTKVLIGGVPALLQGSAMTTNCVAPVPNGAMVKFAGQTAVNAAG
jgi:uncharacterized Zn-binding protein involved in type VI secretion